MSEHDQTRLRVDGANVPVISDTQVYQDGDGYERLVLVHLNDNTLYQAHVRVDKAPEKSFAVGEVWVPASGWNRLVTLPANDWWKQVPGYLRWSNDSSDIATYRLIVQIFEAVAKIPIS